jgi:phosphatidylserine decarboxylase
MMTVRHWLRGLGAQEDLNFLLTNRIPRLALTHFMGWFSQIQNPWICRASIYIWRLFTDIDLSEARERDFKSLHAFFIRELKDGARVVDPRDHILTSPCDGILGSCGSVQAGQVFQAKGFPYPLEELFGNALAASPWHDGVYATIRITSAMYHRFHAPFDGRLHRIDYLNGDTWNVNPIALKRVEKLFCKNERAVLHMTTAEQHPIALVPVAAILVASIRLHAIDTVLHTRYQGPHRFDTDHAFQKGQEMGWFQHGSTILVFAPKGFALFPGLDTGSPLKMGQALMSFPNPA